MSNVTPDTEPDFIDNIMAQDEMHMSDDLDVGGDDEAPVQPQSVEPKPPVEPGATDGSGSDDGDADEQPATQQQVPGQQPQKELTEEEKRQVKANKDGDLVDAQGNVIARRGKERRLYHQVERLNARMQDMERDYQGAVQYAQRLEGLLQEPQRMGLSQQDVSDAYKYAGLMKRDPVAGAKAVLAMALSQGYTLDQIIGMDGGNALNTQAIQQMIEQKVNPVLSYQQQKIQEEQVMQEAQRATNQFYAEFPDASVHEKDIIGLMNRIARPNEDPVDTARRAWTQLREFIQREQLDITLPVEPQLIAKRRMQQRQQTAPQPQQQAPVQQRQIAPMPSGRGGQSTQQSATPMARATDSWDDIIRRTLNPQG